MSVLSLAVIGVGAYAGARHSTRPAAMAGDPPADRRAPQTRRSAAPAGGHKRHARRPPSPSPSPSPASRAKAARVTVRGHLVDTMYGPVRVQIVVGSGRITSARAIERPSGDGTTDQINSYAIPLLDRATVTAQSANIDTVSGATFTSEGYQNSLQSAIDAAHREGAL
jgi:uncharacterized protein with FMN-binding domain